MEYMFITNHVWQSRGVAGSGYYAAIQIQWRQKGGCVREKEKKEKKTVTLYSYLCPEILPFSLTVSFSLPVFSIVARQIGAAVIRKGVFDQCEWSLGTLWGMWALVVVVEQEPVRSGSLSWFAVCWLLRLIWRGAREMIKAQVKSLIEPSFRLISLLPLPAKALNPPPCTLRGGMSLPAQSSVLFRMTGQHSFNINILTCHTLFVMSRLLKVKNQQLTIACLH